MFRPTRIDFAGLRKSILVLIALAALTVALPGCDSSPEAIDPLSASVTGTVTYLERIALPDGAVATIRLQDVSLQDVAATPISTLILPDPGQVPFPFEVKYNPSVIVQSNTYTIAVRIEVDDELWFINTTAYPVITRGNPDHVDVVVQLVRGQ